MFSQGRRREQIATRGRAKAIAISTPMPQIRLRMFVIAVALISVLLLGAFAAVVANGQEPYNDPLPIADRFNLNTFEGVDPDDSDAMRDARALQRQRRQERSRVRSVVMDVFRDSAPLGSNQADFQAYLGELIIPEMTANDSIALGTLGARRKAYFDLVRGATNQGAVTQAAETIMLPALQSIVTENYHPAVRISALTMIGELNAIEGIRNQNAPVPLPSALTFLIEQINSDTAPEYIKAASLSGIARHARVEGQRTAGQPMAAADRDQIITIMLGYLGAMPDGADEQLYRWRARQAIRVLGYLGSTGDGNAVATALHDRMLNEENVFVRCDAANAYGMLAFASGNDARVSEVALTIGDIALLAARNELQYLDDVAERLSELEQWRVLKPEDANSASGGPGPGAGGDDEQPGAGGAGAGGSGAPGGGAPGAPGAPGGPGAGFGGGGSGAFGGNDEVAEVIELPVYVSMLSRRRLKSAIVSIQSAMGDEDTTTRGLWRLGSDADKTFMDQLQPLLEDLMTATDAGLAPARGNDDDPRDQLEVYRDSLSDTIDDIDELLGQARGVDEDADAAAADAADGFGSGGDDTNNN